MMPSLEFRCQFPLAALGSECRRIAKKHVMAGVPQHLLLNSPGCGEKVDRLLPLGG